MLNPPLADDHPDSHVWLTNAPIEEHTDVVQVTGTDLSPIQPAL